MEYKHLDEEIKYDGSQIKPSWALKEKDIKGSSVVTWIGPMDITSENLCDFEDVGLDIKSDKMVHFIVEHFDIQPADIRTAYLRQRILVMIFSEALSEKKIICRRKGDDLYINQTNPFDIYDGYDPCKLTVSIASVSISSSKIHFGVNLSSEGTPNDINTIGLYELGDGIFNENNIKDFVEIIARTYIREINDIECDISKTRPI